MIRPLYIRATIVSTLFTVLLFAGSLAAQSDLKCDPKLKDCPSDDVGAVSKTEDDTALAKPSGDLKSVVSASAFSSYTKEASRFERPAARTVNTASSDAETPQTPSDDAQALAKKLSNPVASLISLPFQSNFDFGMGPAKDGFRYTLNVQPVIPIALNKNWNVISRTIVPIIGQNKAVGTTSQFGLGDTSQSFFFSPNKAEPFIWGIGPQFLIPTGTNQYLGTQKFGVGLTGLILKQKGKWTVGTLINHMWSVAGKSTRADVSLTYFQPFLSYTTKTAWTYNVNTETTYDWVAKTSNVPIHFTVSKLVRFGKQPVSIGGSLRCWAHSAPGGPHWCGFRLIITPLFPKK